MIDLILHSTLDLFSYPVFSFPDSIERDDIGVRVHCIDRRDNHSHTVEVAVDVEPLAAAPPVDD